MDTLSLMRFFRWFLVDCPRFIKSVLSYFEMFMKQFSLNYPIGNLTVNYVLLTLKLIVLINC